MTAQRPRLTSVESFWELAEALKGSLDPDRVRCRICITGCRAFGALEVCQRLRSELAAQGLQDTVEIVETGCHGFCARAPVMEIDPWGYFYQGVEPDDIPLVVSETLQHGRVVEKLLYTPPGSEHPVVSPSEVPFYAAQEKRVLRNCGQIDPRSLEQYIQRGGYAGLTKVLEGSSPEEVIEEVTVAGLRGRGGAGFPTGRKWSFCRAAPGDTKYLICNADEGDPGAFMDRAVLEGDPQAVIEGMVIAAYAIGATVGFIYVRSEYPIAIEHLHLALEQARELGLLGNNILGTDLGFDVQIVEGAGAFVCGEETALIASIEGRRGMPRPRPPFPATSGLWGQPTNINNVETFANVPLLVLNGAEWYATVGTEGSKGTKIFALAGKVNNTGLVEVPMGATLRQIIFDIGGGILGGKKFKAAQMGGPSGGCVPARFLDLLIDYDSVEEIGAIMGSGGLIVTDENTCMVDLARYFMEFVTKESCGKCTPCRIGTKRMLEILTRITEGQGQPGDLDQLERLAQVVKTTSLCGLGQTAPNPILSTLRYFRDEYEEHIYLGHCRAAACEALVYAPCQHSCPAGVNVPEYVALIAEGKLTEAVNLVRRRNPFVSVCGRVCDHPCERRCRRTELDEPLAIRALKRYAADHAPPDEKPLAPPTEGETEVAIVGAGPAGLSCAYFLALMGRRSVVFEALPIAGGMLAVGIPEYRLPKDILQRDIDFILAHGVDLRTNTRIDNLDELRRQYKVVFVGTGAQRGRPLGVEGESLSGVVDGLEFLRQRALGGQPQCGKTVVVIGGGNAAVDAARSALRLGVEKVMILYRRTREQMPAYPEEVEEALREGVEMHFLVTPSRVVGKKGSVAAIELTRMELGPADEDGRPRPVPMPDSEFVLECDMIISAVGQVASVEIVGQNREAVVERGRFTADPLTWATPVEAIYAGGDCVTGGGTVIEAIGAGQKAAIAIDKSLGGGGELLPDVGFSRGQPVDEEIPEQPRAQERILPVEERLPGFAEVLLGFEEADALTEAGRCLRCDLEKSQPGAALEG